MKSFKKCQGEIWNRNNNAIYCKECSIKNYKESHTKSSSAYYYKKKRQNEFLDYCLQVLDDKIHSQKDCICNITGKVNNEQHSNY